MNQLAVNSDTKIIILLFIISYKVSIKEYSTEIMNNSRIIYRFFSKYFV